MRALHTTAGAGQPLRVAIASSRPLFAAALAELLSGTSVAAPDDNADVVLVDVAEGERLPAVVAERPTILMARGSSLWRRRVLASSGADRAISFDHDVTVLADLLSCFQRFGYLPDVRARAGRPAGRTPQTPSGRAEIVVVDDRALARSVLGRAIYQRQAVPVAEAATEADALAMAAPGAVVLVVASRRADLRQLCGAIGAAGRRVVVVGEVAGGDLLEAAVHAGADGYVGPESSFDELEAAIASAARGEAFVPPALLAPLLRDLVGRHRAADVALARVARLSERERAVLRLLADGADHEAIATTLFVSTHTVRTHLRNLYRKLGVHSRKEAVAMVTDHEALDRLAIADVSLGIPDP
jgi:DNA-binding NarL/FixJ family response regulator